MIHKPTSLSQTYQIQFDFHFDTTQRLLELARALPDDLYHAQNGYSHGSIHHTLCHALGSTQFWRQVINNTVPEEKPEDIPGMDELAALLEGERTGWAELLATFDDASLLGTFTRQTPWGPGIFTYWNTLQHVILHGMQHHTELARALTEAGHSPGDMDFLSFQEP